MQPLRALVQNGRIVLDEPTDLPDGVVELVPLEAAEAEHSAEEVARLREALREGHRQARAGELTDAAQALAEIRADR